MNVYKNLLGATLLVVFFCSAALGQYIHPVYRDKDSLDNVEVNSLHFRFQNANYFKNNEYFGEIIPGYTLPGIDMTPLLVYRPTSKIKIEAGYQFKLFLGEDTDMKRASFLRFHWAMRDWFGLVIGTLYSHNSHGLPEPMMNPEYSFSDLRDEGLQFLFHTKWLDADAWVSWDDFIWFGDTKNEKVWGGLAARLKTNAGDFNISVPVYITADHVGGQIDDTDTPATTELNAGSGLQIMRKFKGTIKSIKLSSEMFVYANDIPQNYDYFRGRMLRERGYSLDLNRGAYLMFSDASRSERLIFDNGYGSLTRAVVETNNWKFAAGYWYGYNYYSTRGEYVYDSKSPLSGKVLSQRQFVHLHTAYRTDLHKGIQLAVALDAYQLLDENKTDLGMGIYVLFNRDFFIGMIKERKKK